MLDFQKNIRSERVWLRPLQAQDFEVMWALTQVPAMWYYFTADLSKADVLKHWIKTALEDHAQQKSLPFAIIEAQTQQIVGSTRVANLSARDRRVEIGWTWLAPSHQGTGLNGHVKQLLFEYLFTETDTWRIELKTDVLNLPARKAMEKVGLVQEGILRSHTLMINNRRRDTIFYSLLKEEWLNR